MNQLLEAYHRLAEHYGPQHWWPGETPLEVMVGAVLVQNTAWKNAAGAIDNLREAGVLEITALVRMPVEELAELIRPAGYYRLKAQRLANLLKFVAEQYDGSLEQMFAAGMGVLREQLLGIHGIGPETADAILLYAGGLPSFVVDTYTHRVLARHGWIEFEADYHAIKEHCESTLPSDVPLFNEYHALLVQVGKDHCKKLPKCEGCPLAPLLPDGQPLEQIM